MNFYKRHIGDYIKKAGHLTLLEHGIYARLMDVYYTREAGIPQDKAARLIGARSKDELQALTNVLDEFFTLADGLWTQNRCEEEIDAANAQADANRNNGKKGGRPKRKESETKPTNNPMGFHSDNENNLSQTPDTRLQTPDLTHRASTQPELGAGGSVEPTPVGVLSMTMRGFGIMSNPGDPRLMAIADQGVTAETVKAACEQAKRSKPNEPIGPAYVIAILERWAKEASELNAAGATRPATPGSPAQPVQLRKPQGMDPKGPDESYEEWDARVNAELARRQGNGA
jgi:uncharacterized protein YdaU (DUF1376 family)